MLSMASFTACNEEIPASLVDEASRNERGQIQSSGKVGVLRLKIGDCFTNEGDTVEFVLGVPCSEPRSAKVFAIFELPVGDYPGAEKTKNIALMKCFDESLNTPEHLDTTKIISISGYAPDSNSWASDRSVICFATPKIEANAGDF
jgi:hypothetical protein|tara:strand:+ start:1240 stop:1677 length:438 start_codon:yes stop_codon:yes gene_type:complete